jgi:hypothetical protein
MILGHFLGDKMILGHFLGDKMFLATFWATFSRNHPVTLIDVPALNFISVKSGRSGNVLFSTSPSGGRKTGNFPNLAKKKILPKFE